MDFPVGSPVMNLIEGVWWPCLLVEVKLEEKKPYFVSFFNENTVCSCRKREIVIFQESVAQNSLAKLRKKRRLNPKLLEKFIDDCRIAKLHLSDSGKDHGCLATSIPTKGTPIEQVPGGDSKYVGERAVDTEVEHGRLPSGDTCDRNDSGKDHGCLATSIPAKGTPIEQVPGGDSKYVGERAVDTEVEHGPLPSGDTCDRNDSGKDHGCLATSIPTKGTPIEQVPGGDSKYVGERAVDTEVEHGRLPSGDTCDRNDSGKDHGCLATSIPTKGTPIEQVPGGDSKYVGERAVDTEVEHGRLPSGDTCDRNDSGKDHGCLATSIPTKGTPIEQVPGGDSKYVGERAVDTEVEHGPLPSGDTCDRNDSGKDHGCLATSIPTKGTPIEQVPSGDSKYVGERAVDTEVEHGPLPSGDRNGSIKEASEITLEIDALGELVGGDVFDIESLEEPELSLFEDVISLEDHRNEDDITPSKSEPGCSSDSDFEWKPESDWDSSCDGTEVRGKLTVTGGPVHPAEVISTNESEISNSIASFTGETNKVISTSEGGISNFIASVTGETNKVISTSEGGISNSMASCTGETVCHPASHVPPAEELITRDEKRNGIYIKKTAKETEEKRTFDNYHCCFICHKLVSNIRKHIYIHKENKDIQHLIEVQDEVKKMEKSVAKSEKQKELDRLLAILRNRGDHAHNLIVNKTGIGELLISRRTAEFKAEQFGPCPLCLEWIKIESSSYKHQLTCPVSKKSTKLTKGEAIVRSAVIAGKLTVVASKTLVKEVYPIMTRDKETKVAQSDDLIVALGNNWIRKNFDNKYNRKYYTSSHMRGAARLLLQLHTISGDLSPMEAFLKPCWFDEVAASVLRCCQQDAEDEEDLKHPSAALKLGYDLGHLANLKLSLALKTGNLQKRDEATEFLHLMKLEWTTKVSKLVHSLLNDRRMLKNVSLPLPADLHKLNTHLKLELNKLDLEKDPTTDTFLKIVALAETRLLVYNKRRAGELEAMTLANYHSRSRGLDPADEALMAANMSELEKFLMNSQEIIKIRGKVSKIVPVLVPEDTKAALAFITDGQIRSFANIKDSNEFVFANTGKMAVRAYDSLKNICREASLTCPDRITSISMRKYIATMSQVVALKDHELKWLCKHLGHTANVHDIHYRGTSGYIERVNIGKLLLMTEFESVEQFAGKSLQEITAQDILGSNVAKTIDKQGETEESQPHFNVVKESLEEMDENEDEPPRKRRKVDSRKRWSEEEEDELKELFAENFEKGTCPGIKQCTDAIIKSRMNSGRIYLRGWETIKKKVFNMLLKLKK